jgi:hypothetical protein
MKFLLMASAVVIFLISCKKTSLQPVPVNEPEMIYADLNDSSILFNKAAVFDLNGDGQKDIYFTTLLVGDPVMQADKRQWLVMSSFYTNLPVNEEENIPVLSSEDLIPLQNFQGYNWYNASSVILAQKIVTNNESFWLGEWKVASHKFIPVQITKPNGIFNGWVEVSFDKNAEKLILHKAGISREANRLIKAGL